MLIDFYRDLEAAKPAENLVLQLLSSSGYKVENVSNDRYYYKRGDIKLTLPTGKVIFIDVKNDSRIADTGNFLAEYAVYIKDSDYFIDGDMKKQYDIIAVVSKKEQKVYFIDFNILSAKYRQGDHIVIKHYDQDTWGYLVQLAQIKSWGALLGTIGY